MTAGGLLLVPAAPASATPWPGPEPTPTDLQFYFHNSSSGVPVGSATYLQVMSTANDTSSLWTKSGGTAVGAHYDSVAFVAAPQLAAPLVLNGTVDASVYISQNGSSLGGGSGITISVYSVSPTGQLTILATGPSTSTGVLPAGSTVAAPIHLPGPTLAATTIPAGDSLEVTVNISGNSATIYTIWWGTVKNTLYQSTVSLPASTYLTVSTPAVTNSTGAPEYDLSAAPADKSVTISAVVSDPLGAYDFESWPVLFTIFNATGAAVYGPVAMTPEPSLAAPGAPSGIYNATYNYSGLAPGEYSFNVSAIDNTNHYVGGQDTLPTFLGRAASNKVGVVVGLPPVALTVKTVDDRSQTLAGAVVRAAVGAVLLASNTTDANGQAGFSLPNDTRYNFTVYWQGVWAGNFTELVNAPNLVFVLSAKVLYPTFLLETPEGVAVPYALVSIVHPNGQTLPLSVSNAQGKVSLEQVPVGNYTLTVIFDDVVVLNAHVVDVTSDASPIPVVVAGVFPLTVNTDTAGGSSLSGIFVTVINDTTGATIASGVTNNSAALTFLVPKGTYDVVGDWSTTYYLTPERQVVTNLVTVTGPTTTTLKFTKAFPSFTQTNEFYLILGFAVLGAIIAVLAVLLVRSRKKTVPPLTPAPPISPPEATKEPEPKK